MPGKKKPGPSIKRPAQYEAIKAEMLKSGMPMDRAQMRAARISNGLAKKKRKAKK
ncbi:MAG TPA: hypothetical protein VF832_15535 [Longimicrobiales bacterium]